jgi:hypothetical protein
MDHPQPRAIADPILDRSLKLKLERFELPNDRDAVPGSPHVSAAPDPDQIGLVLQSAHQRRGNRFTNALDAIAAAKRARK